MFINLRRHFFTIFAGLGFSGVAKTESVKSGGELLNWDGGPLCRIDVNVVLEEILEHPASRAT